MAASNEFRELLFADLALLRGHAEARQVAAALLRYWDRRDRTDSDLASELAKLAGIDKAAIAGICAEVDRFVSGADGDPQLALTRRATPYRSAVGTRSPAPNSSRRRYNTMKTSWAASSTIGAGTPKPRTNRHTSG